MLEPEDDLRVVVEDLLDVLGRWSSIGMMPPRCGTTYLIFGKRSGIRRAIRCRTIAASSSEAPTETVKP